MTILDQSKIPSTAGVADSAVIFDPLINMYTYFFDEGLKSLSQLF